MEVVHKKKKGNGPKPVPIVQGTLYISNGKGKLARITAKNAVTEAVQMALRPFCYDTRAIPGLASTTVQVPNKICVASEGPLTLLADSPDCLFNLDSLLTLLPTMPARSITPGTNPPTLGPTVNYLVGTLIESTKRDNALMYTLPYSTYKKYHVQLYKEFHVTEDSWRASKPNYRPSQTIQKLKSK